MGAKDSGATSTALSTRAVVVLIAMLLATFAAMVVQPQASAADPVDDCYPVPEDGCPLDDAIEARVLGPYCEQDVPHLRWDLDVSGADDSTRTTVRFVNPDGEDLVYTDQPLAGTLLWPGAAADSTGAGTDWPGWEFRDGGWVEVEDAYAFTRDDVVIRFDVAPGYEAVVPYPPPTSACADPTQVRPVVLERDDETPQALVEVGGVTLARTGTDALLLAVGGLSALGLGTGLVLRGRRRGDPGTPTT